MARARVAREGAFRQDIFSTALNRRPVTGPLMPNPGSTEHALFVLVLLELGALIALRRYFRSAHGG